MTTEELKIFRVRGTLTIEFDAEIYAEDRDEAREYFEDDPERACRYAVSEDLKIESVRRVKEP